jgi:hypothetical protein
MGSVLPGCALLASDVRLLRDEVESPRRRLASEVAMSDDAELRFACEGMVGVEGGHCLSASRDLVNPWCRNAIE